MTKQTSNPDIQQDFKNCILNVHGIKRKLPNSYCYFINELKSNNNKTSDISLAERKQLSDPGIILVGKTGVGKTELAHFLGEITKSIVIPVEMSNLVSSEIGATAVNVHKEFERARQRARDYQKPVILIFNEIDRIAKYMNTETAQAVELRAGYQQFNSEVDRCKKDGDIFVVGTTNYINECAPEFRNRLTEISITEPLSVDERKDVLSWYIMGPTYHRILESKNIVIFHQAMKEKLPTDLRDSLDKLIQSIYQLDEESIAEKGYLPESAGRDHYTIYIPSIDYLTKLSECATVLDNLASKYNSLNEYSFIEDILVLQREKFEHYVYLSTFFFLEDGLIKKIAKKTNTWNFRELENLSSKIRNSQEQLTEKTIFAWIDAIEKTRSALSCEKNSADYVETGLNVISWTAKIASYFF